MFKLDDKLEQDSFLVKEYNDFQIRLMDVSEAVSYTHLTLPTSR